jgi:hypothetical protein
MALCVGGFSYLGIRLDGVWGTGTLMTILGFLLGTAAGFYGVFREALRKDPKA